MRSGGVGGCAAPRSAPRGVASRHGADQADKDRYLGLVAAGWALAVSVPVAALPIAFLLLDRRSGHGVGILTLVFLEFAAVVGLLVAASS